jgi:hypothetical protein
VTLSLEPVLMKDRVSDEVHAGSVREGEAWSWCGALRENGESDIVVFRGPLSDVTCRQCLRQQRPSGVW